MHKYGGSEFCAACGNCTAEPFPCNTYGEECPRLMNQMSAKERDAKEADDYVRRKELKKYLWKKGNVSGKEAGFSDDVSDDDEEAGGGEGGGCAGGG